MKRINLNIGNFKSNSNFDNIKTEQKNIESDETEEHTETNQVGNLLNDFSSNQKILALSIISQIVFNSLK